MNAVAQADLEQNSRIWGTLQGLEVVGLLSEHPCQPRRVEQSDSPDLFRAKVRKRVRHVPGQPYEALRANLLPLFPDLHGQDPGDDVDALILARVYVPAGSRRPRRNAAITERHAVAVTAVGYHSPRACAISRWTDQERDTRAHIVTS